jgi:hypothetical protein
MTRLDVIIDLEHIRLPEIIHSHFIVNGVYLVALFPEFPFLREATPLDWG